MLRTSAVAGHFEREIAEQPEVVQRLLTTGRATAEAIAERVRAARPRFALLAARGSSDNAARYAKYLFGAHNRIAVGLAAPALHTIYGAAPDLSAALVIGISQSGQSPDVVAVVRDATAQGAVTVALTNDAGSPLARAATMTLPLGAGEERAVAASKTYTSQLAALAMLSTALDGAPARWAELLAMPDAMRAALAAAPAARQHAPRLAGAPRIVVLGRGYNFATAFEAALKLKETCYTAAEAYSWADFLHGPIALLEPGFPVLVTAPSGVAAVDVAAIVDTLRARGALVSVISDDTALLARADLPLPLGATSPEWLSPLAAVIPAQLLALATAEAQGGDPDRPRGLAKVTLTT